jgi:parallel beta-helix repeat protein
MLLNNIVRDNREYAFLLSNSKDNILSGNQVSNSGRGIDLSTSEGNKISGNTIISNSISGIFISSTSNNNVVFDNYLNNIYNTDVKEGSVGNVFNTTKTAGHNIVGGQYIGGNFWAKPDGTGFSQTAPDADGDGIADTVYSFSGNESTDFLPLVKSSKSIQSATPVSGLNTSGMNTSNAETNNTKIAANGKQPAANEIQPETSETQSSAGKAEQGSNETQSTVDETQPVTDETQ